MIGSQILFGSKCNLYNYMYNINPELFGKENIKYCNLETKKIIKDNISNFNDKRYMIDNLSSRPHEIYY